MAKEFWLNLPVKNIERSKEFFTKLGFTFNSNHGNSDTSACLLMGEKNVVVMLFEEPVFKGFTSNAIADTQQGTEVLLSLDAPNKEQVDAIIKKAIDAGGASNHQPGEMKGWMYGAVFTDPDGHRWNVLHMDMGKMPKGL